MVQQVKKVEKSKKLGQEKPAKNDEAKKKALGEVKSKKLLRKERKEVEALADQETDTISQEVSELLAQIKKEHGIELTKPEVKAAKREKNKIKKEKLKFETEPEEQTTTAEAAPASSPNKRKKNKKNKKRKANGDDAGDENQVPELPAKKVKLDSQPEVPTENKKKQKKKEKKQKPKTILSGQDAEAKDETVNTEENATENGAEKRVHPLKNSHPVYVGNLPTNTKYSQLKSFFKPCGNILSIRFRTNTGRGIFHPKDRQNCPFIIAFIYFDTKEAALKSLEMNGKEFKGQPLYVDLDPGTENNSKIAPKRTVLVGNLKYAVTSALLCETFKCCGEIDYVRVSQTEKGCKGTAFVCFKYAHSVELAMKLNGTPLLGRECKVQHYSTKKSGASMAPKATEKGIKKPFQKNLKGENKVSAKSASFNTKGKKPFLGVKSNELKKKKKFLGKDKKAKNSMKKLAEKIAPRPKAEQ